MLGERVGFPLDERGERTFVVAEGAEKVRPDLETDTPPRPGQARRRLERDHAAGPRPSERDAAAGGPLRQRLEESEVAAAWGGRYFWARDRIIDVGDAVTPRCPRAVGVLLGLIADVDADVRPFRP